LPGEPMMIADLWLDQKNGFATSRFLEGTTCLESRGISAGVEQLCVVICDDLVYCDTTVVLLNVAEESNNLVANITNEVLTFFTGFSPNSDGENDVLYIDGLQNFPNNTLSVFSKWGTEIFNKKNYQNDWSGIWEGQPIPDGTYFYVFEDGNGSTYSGYVQVNR